MRPRPEQVRDIAVAVCIKTIGGACQDLGKRPRGGIKISSKCTRPPLGGLGHETRFDPTGYQGRTRVERGFDPLTVSACERVNPGRTRIRPGFDPVSGVHVKGAVDGQ